MAGFDNEVMFAPGVRLEPTSAQSITLMQDGTTTNVSRINYTGNPNGLVSANPGSLSHDPVSGFIYVKVSGTGTTVWQRIIPSAGTSVISVGTQTGIDPIVPTVGGLINIDGAIVAAGTNPVRSDGTGPNTLAIEVQTSQALAAADPTKIGLSNFNSDQFTVDANGFVSTSGTGVVNGLTGNTGGFIAPVAGNINTLGSGSITIAGAGNTLTTQLTGLTDHAVLVGAGTDTITKVGPTATAGQVLQSAGATADPAFSTATYPLTTTANQILYSSISNAVVGLPTANRAVLTTSATGVPALTPLATDGQLIIGSTAGAPAAANITSADSSVTVTNGSNSISLTVTGGTTVGKTITGQSGGPLSPTAGNWNIFGSSTAAGSSPVVTSGAGSTLTVNVQKSQALAAPDATKVGLCNFNSADFSVDADGFVSRNSGATVITLTGNAGGAIPPDGLGNIDITTANATPIFDGSGNSLTLDFNKENLLLGASLGVVSAIGNVGIGGGSTGAPLTSLTSGQGNVAIGAGTALLLSSGSNNCLIGARNGRDITSAIQNVGIGSDSLFALQTGGSNTALGQSTLSFLTTGSRNIAIGISSGTSSSGQSYNGAESSNIVIGNTGVNGESNVIRLGTNGSSLGQQNSCYVAGITGSTVAASAPIGVASTGQLSSLGFGVAGEVFTSGGAGVSPSWQAAGGGALTLTGNSGGALSPTGGNWNIVTSNASIAVAGTGSTLTLNFNQTNLVLGSSIPSLTSGVRNVGLGSNCLNALTSGADCTVAGYQAGQAINGGQRCTLIGSNAGAALTASVDVTAIGANALVTATGGTESTAVGSGALRFFTTISNSRNTAIGHNSLPNLQTGVRNIGLGYTAGTTYTGSESSNIIIGSTGTIGDNNTVRIGSQGSGVGQQNLCFISGITGATVTGTAVLCSTAGQLGTISSSLRYKENVTDMSEDVSIMHLRPVEFNYKSDASQTKKYGLIAEEVEQDFPYLCFYNENNEPESVQYHELPVLLLKEIQRLNQRITALEANI